MVATALLLCLFLLMGVLIRAFNRWTHLLMALTIIGVLVLFYLT
jgi:hypothetical protein